MVIQTKNVELLENSKVKLTITVSGSAVQEEYDSTVKDHCKTVHLKGFRKGKVPPEILKRKFRPTLISETTQKILNTGFQKALETIDQKPLTHIVPTIKTEEDLEPGKDFSFEVLYEAYPHFELTDYSKIEIEELKVTIADEDIQRDFQNELREFRY